jgi:ubiquitin C-terminal hydrolase
MGTAAHIIILHEQSSPPDAERATYMDRKILNCSASKYGGGIVPRPSDLIGFIVDNFKLPGSDYYMSIPHNKQWKRVSDSFGKIRYPGPSHVLITKGDESAMYMFKLSYKGAW